MSQENNVFIEHRVDGRLVQEIETHNVWVQRGRVYLAEIVGYLPPISTLTPEREERIKYLGLGVGGVYRDGTADIAPISTAYPPGSAEERYPPEYTPGAFTNGRKYNRLYPISPLIETLEAPVRISGGTAPYPGGPSDVWRIGPPNLYVTHASTQELTIHATVNTGSGEVVYPPFTSMPITEAGLYTNVAGTSNPYEKLVAYVGFTPLILTPTSVVDFTWRVRFA